MYTAEIEGQELTFGVAGVWRRNMVIQDWETGSVWQQATGEAIAGPLKGKTLRPISGSLVKWGMWSDQHQEGILGIEPDPPAPNLLSVEGMVRLFEPTRHFAGPGLVAKKDNRLPLHEVVIGVDVNGAARAYPLDVVREKGEITDSLGGQPITINYHPEGDSVEVRMGEEPVSIERLWWLGWSEFHPETDIFT